MPKHWSGSPVLSSQSCAREHAYLSTGWAIRVQARLPAFVEKLSEAISLQLVNQHGHLGDEGTLPGSCSLLTRDSARSQVTACKDRTHLR